MNGVGNFSILTAIKLMAITIYYCPVKLFGCI